MLLLFGVKKTNWSLPLMQAL